MRRPLLPPLGLFAIVSAACVPHEIAGDAAASGANEHGGSGADCCGSSSGSAGEGSGYGGRSVGGAGSGGAGSDGAGGEDLGLPNPPEPPAKPLPSGSVCEDPEGYHAYLLNEIFIREGHPFLHVDPDWAGLVDQTPGLNSWNPAGWSQPYSTANQCAILINDEVSVNYNTCDSDEPGRCHCWDSSNVCRCDKILREAHKAVCTMIFATARAQTPWFPAPTSSLP